ncbi:MAG: glycosyltransferase [Elusimicrobia bacterium]|nr:glycosyltransferase [Elusimicrobiota bacterium]
MKKKILFVIYSIYGGGAEKRTQKIFDNLDRTKFEPHLCVFHLTGKERLQRDIPVYNLSTKLKPASFFLIWKLIKLILVIKPNKIFSVLWSVNLISIIAAKFTNIPIIINEVTTLSSDIKEYSFCFLRKKLVCFLYPKALVVVAVSEFTKSDLIEKFKIKEDKIITIHNGVDVKAIESFSSEYNVEHKNFILACGGLTWLKNHVLLIEAAAQLENTTIIILGVGKLKEQLAAKAKKLGVNLILPGYLDNPYPYFKNAMAFVLTSFYEGFPNILLEAMALKTPVISVDCPSGIREIINNGETGLIVEPNNKEALANAIKKIMANSEMRKELVQNAYSNLNIKFTLKNMVRKYEEVFYQ